MFKSTGVLFALLMMLASSLASAQTAGAGISGTAHDSRAWFSSDQVCVMCHAPHNANAQGPLWNHAASGATYTLYASSTMNATVGQPGSASKLCLSCHDGTVGVNDYGGATGGMTLADAYGCTNCNSVIGTNLANDHPIGITYDAALAAADGKLYDPAAKSVTIGSTVSKSGTVSALMLVGGKVECTSCHDVHNRYTVTTKAGTSKGLVKVGLTGSSLCLQCHNK